MKKRGLELEDPGFKTWFSHLTAVLLLNKIPKSSEPLPLGKVSL